MKVLNNKLVVIIFNFFLKPFKLRKIIREIERIYENVPSYSLSKQYRSQHDSNNPDFIYGELHIESFLYLLDLIPKPHKRKIVDLGCGDGKLLLAAALYYRNTEFRGYEIVPKLVDAAQYAMNCVETKLRQRQNRLFFHNINFITTKILDSDIIYCNSAAFKTDTWKLICQNFFNLKQGSYVISVEQKILHPNFVMLHSGLYDACWGPAMVYIFQKQ